FTLRRVGTLTELAEQTCATAPTFWQWRPVPWPDLEAKAVPADPSAEWKQLAGLAGACASLGLAGWLVTLWDLGPAWLATVCYGLALLAGAWDAAIDTWSTLRRGKVDIHFLMLAVALGAVV